MKNIRKNKKVINFIRRLGQVVVILILLAVGVVFITIGEFVYSAYKDRKAEKIIDYKFHQEIETLPQLKVKFFLLWEGDAIVTAEVVGKGEVRFWYGEDGVPRITNLGHYSTSYRCFYVNEKGEKQKYFHSIDLVLDKESKFKKWFPFQVSNLKELVERYDDIAKILATFPTQEETLLISDRSGVQPTIPYSDSRFTIKYSHKGKEVWCDLYNVDPNSSKQILQIDNTLNDLVDLFHKAGFKRVRRMKNNMWWVSDDNWSILVKDSQMVGVIYPEAYSELKKSSSKTSKLIKNISAYFVSQGYKQNFNNSSKSVEDSKFYDFIRGFETKEEKCLITVDPDNAAYFDENGKEVKFPTITVSCASTSSLEDSYNKQIPFLRAMGNRDIVVDVSWEDGKRAIGESRGRRVGGIVYFVKKNNSWEEVAMMQDNPDCEFLKKYDFPLKLFSLLLP